VLHREGQQRPHGGDLRVPQAKGRFAILGAHGLAQRLGGERDPAAHRVRPGGTRSVRGWRGRLSGGEVKAGAAA